MYHCFQQKFSEKRYAFLAFDAIIIAMDMFADVIINRKSPAVDRVFTYAVPPHLQGELKRGMLVRVPFNREKLEGVAVRLHDEAPQGFTARDILDLLSDKPLFSDELLRLAAWISEYYVCTRAAALQAMLPAGMTLSGRPPRIYYREVFSLADAWQQAKPSPKRRRLAAFLQGQGEADAQTLAEAGFSRDFLRAAGKAGLLRVEQRRVVEGAEQPAAEPAALSAEQQAVLDDILREQAADNRPYLLHGVTGSGKTELYLRLIAQAARAGRQSIVLVPEIALSTQMVDMLMRRLELPMAVLHSGLKPAERRHIWQEIAEGRITCVVGARSAVFAPLPRLGQIIIDEAHESSYKQDSTPRFSALTVAERRARFSGASLVLGSATPSVEQYYAAETGRYAKGELTGHYFPAPAPRARIVDMRAELREGNKTIFSRALYEALCHVLDHGEQAVLFMNRRGYYQHYACRDCGASIHCPHCAVAMSFHNDAYGGRLKCHYCGRSIAPPSRCPQCGSAHIRKFGVGTQRVAEELQRLFPAARVLRLDSDVIGERGSHERIYRAMRAGEADFLVGTQMVAKGLDFPRLTLAAVMAADTLLNLPDWRAAERTFQLITQLSGRAGRREKQGLAIIQTYTPEARPVVAAAAGDYRAFYRAELQERDMHGYPPFMQLIRVLFSGREQAALVALSRAYAHYLRPLLSGGDEICGPADAPLAKIKDRFRRQLILKCGDAAAGAAAVEQAALLLRAKERLPADFQLAIDVDPFSVM